MNGTVWKVDTDLNNTIKIGNTTISIILLLVFGGLFRLPFRGYRHYHHMHDDMFHHMGGMHKVSLRQRIAPVPLDTVPWSGILKADTSSVPGFVFFDFKRMEFSITLDNKVDLVCVLIPIVVHQAFFSIIQPCLTDFRNSIIF